jgi:membrane protein implicated in regulation of membrane protease activity
MATVQFIINLIFTVFFLVWLFATTYLLYLIWKSFNKLIEAMQQTILENARKNVETIGELAKVLETHQQTHEPPP